MVSSLTILSKFKLVVFDMDGTMIDSPLDFDYIKKELDIPAENSILEHLNQLPTAEKKMREKQLENIEVDFAKNAVPMPGFSELLQSLLGRGIKVAILTRNCRAVVDIVLKKLNWKIDCIVTRDDTFPPKPHPEGLNSILRQFETDKEDAVFVGDFKYDVDCAKNAGIKSVLYSPDGSNRYQADIVIEKY